MPSPKIDQRTEMNLMGMENIDMINDASNSIVLYRVYLTTFFVGTILKGLLFWVVKEHIP